MYGIPDCFVLSVMFVLGSVIGSFLDVFTLRFHTGKSINGRSHCLSCGHKLAWYELFPLFSYLFLRGRCRVCGAKIPARLFWIEVMTGVLFMGAYAFTDTLTELVIALVFVALAVVITIYDLRHMIIPNVFVAAVGILAVATLLLELPKVSIATLWPFVASGLLASLFYFCLWWFSKGKWIGFGDVKLVLPLGFMLTPLQTFSFVVLSFWVGAVISIGLLLTQWLIRRGQTHLRFSDITLTIKSEVPFAPFLLIAFVIVRFFQFDVLSLFTITL